jgi:hypothetical protein
MLANAGLDVVEVQILSFRSLEVEFRAKAQE